MMLRTCDSVLFLRRHKSRQEGDSMIQITMNSGIYDEWKPEQYTDYMYDGKCFIIIKGEQWVGIYNMDSVRRIVIDK